jgi:hypothetical protein
VWYVLLRPEIAVPYVFWYVLLRPEIAVEDILLCLKYNIKMKQNVLCLSQLSFILLFQMLATSFGLNGPPSGQYL